MVEITDTQRSNLIKLADYLASLPDDYQQFDMENFLDTPEVGVEYEYQAAQDPQAYLHECGAVACAVGHGPAAGISAEKFMINEHIDWETYSSEVFMSYTKEWEWMFGGNWAGYDNTALGASKRIRYILTHGSAPMEFQIGYLWNTDYQDYIKLYQ